MKLKDIVIRGLKKTYRFISKKTFLNPKCNMDRQSVNDKIFALLTREESCMISRFGTVELNCINNFLCIQNDKNYLKKIIEYIVDDTHTPWWNEDHFRSMRINAGIFPSSVRTSVKFSKRSLQDIPFIDLLGSFQYYEKFMPLQINCERVHLETLYPFFVKNPWTKALKGKKVLVIHPFDISIQKQYNKRKLLFKNKEILPEFELITLKAVQSIAGTNVPFKSWFEALKYMENKITSIDFDICILGCGAYGMPLAAHVKRMDKKAIHLGGGTQLLFGIKGKRWEQQYERNREYRPNEIININYIDLFNENWAYPAIQEKPKNASKVENGCYW
jgi:hypothetical protein